MTRRVTVLVADDQAVVREGLRSLLGFADELQVVGAADSAEQALDLIAATDPDVWLTDLRMPGIGGVEGIRRLVASSSRTVAIALTTYDDDATIVEALAAGAVGFLNKDADPAAVVTAIVAAAQGRALLDGRALRALLGRPTGVAATAGNDAGLTAREVEVLQLVAGGMSNAQLARELVVSLATVKTHVNHLLAKTGCRDRAALVAWAYAHDLVSRKT